MPKILVSLGCFSLITSSTGIVVDGQSLLNYLFTPECAVHLVLPLMLY